jgi:hypothetical protein
MGAVVRLAVVLSCSLIAFTVAATASTPTRTYQWSDVACGHIFLWEAKNSFSYLTTDETTRDFLKWVHVNGQFVTQFSAVARYHEVDFAAFRDDKPARGGAGRHCDQT